MGIFGTKGSKFGFGTGRDDDFDDYSGDSGFEDTAEDTAASVEAPAAPAFTAAPLSLKIVAPKAYDDAKEITDFLMNGNTVLLNMDSIERDVAVRILDYLKGAVQVVGGMITKVGKTTIVVAPKNVDVSSIEAMVGPTE
jgi:cell division inhibitor SepF